MKLLSWNVNGIRAAVGKGFVDKIHAMQCDVVCLQETKAQDDQVVATLEDLEGYYVFSNSANRKGYSGTAILTTLEPLTVTNDIGIDQHDEEGRVICAEFPGFFLVTVYTPNSGNGLRRLEYRQIWDRDFLAYLQSLKKHKPVILCGDLNVAHRDIDLARPKPNYNKTAGYTQQEIDGLDNIVSAGFLDTFRYLHPNSIKYSWWSFRAGARAKNIGWRIDYFLCSESLTKNIKSADILNEVEGSDHCPVMLEINVS
ncbi:MAG: exodeoxyribonuclease III [Gammaproteobacteria bacterium]|nr:exodeoxyribonuclease III [Gammaproteobacteria bacterium]